jgi:cobalt-zinc-cadmium efflux system outer membrane protein
MIQIAASCRLRWQGSICYFCWLVWIGLGVTPTWAAQPTLLPPEPPPALSLDAAIRWALEYNPELAALRQQHGIAAAAVVIARTYPFNPIWEGKIRATNGPESAGITNRVSNEHKFLMDVEIRGQGTYRRQTACAALSRTDWEIMAQELNLAVRVIRAYNAVLYRQDKLHLIDETVRLNEHAANQVSQLVQQGKLRSADLIVINTEVADVRSQQGLGRVSLLTAQYELRRSLGVIHEAFELHDTLATPSMVEDTSNLMQAALERRPDLHARQMAVIEADARLRLEIANRYGNPNVGPAYEYDPTRVNLIGVQITLPLPVFNQHRGEILQREAERTRTALELRQTEVLVRQDVAAAVARLKDAHEWAHGYQTQILPNLDKGLKDIEQLFTQGDPGVDLLRVIDIRRKLLKARDGYLDALFELNQVQADLAAAVADPAVSLASGSTPQAPEAPPPQP